MQPHCLEYWGLMLSAAAAAAASFCQTSPAVQPGCVELPSFNFSILAAVSAVFVNALNLTPAILMPRVAFFGGCTVSKCTELPCDLYL